MADKGGAEQYAYSKQYDYRANSSLVLAAENRTRDAHEPTGEPETLQGKAINKMGDRVQYGKPEQLEERKAKSKKRKEAEESNLEHQITKKSQQKGRSNTILDVSQDSSTYHPKTRETRQAYELLLSSIQRFDAFQDIGSDLLKAVADEVLLILKNERLKDPEKQDRIETEIVGEKLDVERFSYFVTIGKMITDFKSRDDEDLLVDGVENAAETGVAVQLEDSDDEQGGSEVDEVIEDSDEDMEREDNNVRNNQMENGDVDVPMDVDEPSKTKRSHHLVNVKEIDAYWLQRQVRDAHPEMDADTAQSLANEIFEKLEQTQNHSELESQLVLLLSYEKFDLIRVLISNRDRIVWSIKLLRAQDDRERKVIEGEMKSREGLREILDELYATRASARERQSAMEKSIIEEANRLRTQNNQQMTVADQAQSNATGHNYLDLEQLAFPQGGRFNSDRTVKLSSIQITDKNFVELQVPAQKREEPNPEQLVQIKDMPAWVRPAFDGMRSLNLIQSRCYQKALFSSSNMLMCAPTGAGKTNVAMLTILAELNKHRGEDGKVDLTKFKIIYVAPMKALVSEMVGNFGNRLKSYGVRVEELTGDVNMSKQQIDDTQIIITTPEKWDIISRKSGDRTFTNMVKLIIIDEVHLLHDDRGPVIESIVARTIRQIESTHEMVRLVGLSATLPNYGDVAGFLRVSEDNLFYFENKYRPVPLAQQFVGVKVKKPLQRFQVMNEICYKKVMEGVQQGHQILIFVHSRKETAKTARFIKEEAMKEGTIGQITGTDAAATEILKDLAQNAKSSDLKDVLPFRIGIHHAGMSRSDRQEIVESLFAEKIIQVLVSTATLAWGVNLPAHTVIIKGTQVYDPSACKWQELSALDTMQMLGRAGRPQYDSQGLGVIITQQSEVLYYAALFNQKLPIESHYIKTVPDNLNAEIVLGTVSNVKEGAQWLGYTYLYVRMLKNPGLYGVPLGQIEDDPTLQERRMDIVHTAASILDRHNLIKYDRRSGSFFITDLGRIASHYYVTHNTMHVFNEHLKPTMGEVELLRLFSLADEFKNMIVREEEKLELAKLIERVPIPIKDSIEEPSAKINVLLQAYISRLQLEGLALSADMVYVTQSAGRIMRCLFEICLRRGCANLTDKALNLCKMINRRMWLSQTPLRQFGADLPADVLTKIERKDISWENYLKLQPGDLGELFRKENLGKVLYKLIHRLPYLQLQPQIQPITRNLIQIDLSISPDFQWNDKLSGAVEPFWIIVEDQDSERILHYQSFMLKRSLMEEDHVISFTVPIAEPLPPQYFVRVVSDRWLQCDTTVPITFRHLILPAKQSPVTELIDLQPVPVSALKNPKYESLYNTFQYFNPIQTQVFTTLYDTDDNFLVAAPVGSGKTICAEFAILRMITRAQQGKCALKCVYVAPFQQVAELRYNEWQLKFGQQLGLNVTQLTGETLANDFKLIEKGNIIVTIPEHWDMVSRRWKRRKAIQTLSLFIVDDLHLISRIHIGSIIEIITTRMRYIAQETSNQIRIVGLSTGCATARDLGDWIGASSRGLFNFDAAARPVPLEVHIQGFDIQNFESRMQAMSRPTYIAINNLAEGNKPVLIFVPTRKHVSMLVLDLLTYAATDQETSRFLLQRDPQFDDRLGTIRDPALRHSLDFGVGFIHEAMTQSEQQTVVDLMQAQYIQVIVATAGTCWGLDIYTHLTIIMGTQYYDAVGLGGNDYSIPDLLQMIGRSSRYGIDNRGKCVIMCHTARKEYYKRFLFDPYPVESVLEGELNDHFNAEIVNKTIENMQEAFDYLTWTFYYRRMAKNPNYYGMIADSHRIISDHLSELVEKTLNELKESQVINIWDETEVSPLNLGMISEHYYINYTTIEIFRRSLTPKTRLKGLLEIISNATEFSDISVRPNEERQVKNILTHSPLSVANPNYSLSTVKINALLQAYFSRIQIGGDMLVDQKRVVSLTVRLLHAMVDVISSDLQWLNLVIQVMELCQMVVQGQWTSDSELLQLPHFTKDLAVQCQQQAQVETVFDLASMEQDQRNAILNLSDRQMQQVARACNRYPDIDMNYEVVVPEESKAQKGGVIGGSKIQIRVALTRDLEDDLPPVESQKFPKRKDEQWWLVIGDPDTKVNMLYAIRKVTVKAETEAKLEFEVPNQIGTHKLQLYFMCDSYLGCDQEYEIKLEVTEEGEDKME